MLYKYDKSTLQFKRISIKQYIYSIILFILLFTSMGFGIAVKTNLFLEKIPVIIRMNEEEFSEQWLKNKLTELNAENIDILIAQSKLETNNYTSNIFKLNKNLFGMKVSQTRITTNKGEQFGHAKYNSYYESVLDVCIWQQSYARNLTHDQYLRLLSEIYAEDSNYKNKLIKILTKN